MHTRKVGANRWVRWPIGLLVLGAGVALGLWLNRILLVGEPFDRTAWQDLSRIDSGVRLGMADRLIARSTLIGDSRDEVIELLGQDPPTGYFQEWDLVYRLGPERGLFPMDSEWLVLRFGPNGRVSECENVRD